MEFLQVWLDGGWVMIPLFLLAVYLYYQAVSLINFLSQSKVGKTPREVWKPWITAPEKGVGHIGDVIRYVTAKGYAAQSVLKRVEEVKAEIMPQVNQKIMLLSVLVTVAPLMGLLGTVIGMLATFRGLALSAGEQTVDLVADGIRVALITTQTGLMIAIPGYILIYMVLRHRNRYNEFLAQVETLAILEGVNPDSGEAA